MEVQFKLLQNGYNLELPSYAHAGDSGVDVRSAIATVLVPFDTKVIPCGFALAIPEGYEGQIRSRSGLASKHGVVVLNSPGTIDSTYTGEIKVILTNQGGFNFEVKWGMRIAQLVFAPVVRATFVMVGELTETARNDNGFGSTGV